MRLLDSDSERELRMNLIEHQIERLRQEIHYENDAKFKFSGG